MKFSSLFDSSATKWDHIISIVWLYFLLFPTGFLFNISIPIILILLFDRKNCNNHILTPLIAMIAISVLVNLGQEYMTIKPIIRSISIGVIFYTFASTKGDRLLFPYVFLAALYIFLSQISLMYHIPIVANFFDGAYNISNSLLDNYKFDITNATVSDVQSGSRLGGMYINPNVCASYMSVIYAVGLCEARQIQKRKTMLYLFVVIVALSFICTGSRTSLIVFAAISLYYLYTQGYSIGKYIVIGLLLLTFFSLSDISSLRMFDIKDGMNSSFGAKMRIFGRYLNECPSYPLFVFFGGGDIAVTSVVINQTLFDGCDCDFGNIFMSYGLFFYIAYIAFNVRIYKSMPKDNRILFLVMLWVFSNSILISYRMCPVWFLCLGLLYRRSIYQP